MQAKGGGWGYQRTVDVRRTDGGSDRRKRRRERRRVGWRRWQRATVADHHTTSRPFLGVPETPVVAHNAKHPPLTIKKYLEREHSAL